MILNRFKGDMSDNDGKSKVLQVISIILVGTYFLYLFSLQVVRGIEFKSRAVSVSKQVSVIPAQRGEIFDRSYNFPMVLNTDSFAVSVIPAEIPPQEREALFMRLSEYLDYPVEEIRRKIPPSYYHLYQSIQIRNSVSFETITKIAERIDIFPGVVWNVKPIRNYLEANSLSHVIGYVGDINRDELQVLYNKGYQSGDIIGKSGIEKQYDSLLRGKEGLSFKTVDVRGRKLESSESGIKPPEMGNSLVLTIDNRIQELAQRALGERMGSVVVLKPATGEILAMVSYPWFDPNIFQTERAGTEYSALINNPNNPLINRAIQSSYPPASTFKIPMTAAIIEENAVSQEKTVDCDGEISYGQRIWKCWIKRPGHGPLNLQQALAQSCDIYFWTVTRDNLGIEKMIGYAKEFGFGSVANIDLPGEMPGFVPTPQWKDRRFHEKWMNGDTMNFSIGQGYMLVTPLQMANMVAMVVNDGKVYTPHVLKEVRDSVSGALISSQSPSLLFNSKISSETFAQVKRNMRTVITEGTAKFPLNSKAVQVAGKTGTGEIGLEDRWHSWFAAYGPYDYTDINDVVVVSVIVEASNKWEWWAPYASNIIFQGIFANQEYDEATKSVGLGYLAAPQARRE